jgi:hypothetical protein
MRPADRIVAYSPLSRLTTDTDAKATVLHWQALPPSLQKDVGATIAHRGSFAAASQMGTNLFPLEGKYPL